MTRVATGYSKLCLFSGFFAHSYVQYRECKFDEDSSISECLVSLVMYTHMNGNLKTLHVLDDHSSFRTEHCVLIPVALLFA